MSRPALLAAAALLGSAVTAGLMGCGERGGARMQPDAASGVASPHPGPVADAGGAPPSPGSAVVEATPTPSPPAAVDLEPNDDWATAISLSPGVPATGILAAPDDPMVGDQDWYRVDVPGDQPALMRVALTGADDLDLVLEWMPDAPTRGRPRAQVQADVHEGEPGPEGLGALRVSPGPVYLRVREAWYRGRARTGSSRPYTLSVELAPWAAGMEAEPDDTAADAIPTALGKVGRGTLGHISDRDVWRIALDGSTAGQPLSVAVTGVPGVQMAVSVAFPNAAQDAALILGKAAADHGLVFRHLAVPEPRPEALLVTVRALAGAALDVPYELLVEVEPETDESVEVEPNDSVTRARPLVEGRVVGHIDRAGDEDHFSVVVTAPTALHALLAPPIELDLALELIGPDGRRARHIDEGRAGDGEILRAFGVTVGTWTLVVRGHGGRAFDSRQPYVLEVSRGAPDTGEAEPNDTREEAGRSPLRPGAALTGWIHPSGDVDWWLLDRTGVDEGGIVTFQVKPAPGVSLDVGVHATSGERLVGGTDLVPPEITTFTYYLDPGTYYVRVSSPDTASANPKEPYTLTVLK